MVYVDSNVFIYAAIYDTEKGRVAKRILTEIAKGKLDARTASLTWDEIVWVIWRVGGAAAARAEGEKFLRLPNLKLLPVNGVLDTAQRVIEKYGLSPRDAIHVACALKNRIFEIISDDRELDKVKEIRRIPLHKAVE